MFCRTSMTTLLLLWCAGFITQSDLKPAHSNLPYTKPARGEPVLKLQNKRLTQKK
jgi:hypothetical protein